ncbi:MAG TPA: tetratricopeptide repeat protein [Bacteroidota bacterium]|nr:tetratricopeptide repeat protein [Bacteroidota bacterium]
MKYFSKLIMSFLLTATVFAAQDPITLGKEAMKRRAFDEAIGHLTTAFKASSRNAEVCYLLGESYRQKENIDSAEYFLTRSLDVNDEYSPAYVSLFPVLAKKGQWAQINKRYATAMKYDKKNPAIPYSLGEAYLEADSLDKAILNFSRAKELDEKFVDAYIGLAEAYSRQNIGAMAIANYQKALEVAPNDPTVHYRLGKSYYKNRQYTESAKEFQEAINLDPKNDIVIYELADLYWRAKLWNNAATFFEKYVALKPDNALAYEHYAKSLYNTKRNYKDAVPVIETAVKLNPNVFDLKLMLAHALYVAKDEKRAVDLYKSVPQDSLSGEDFLRLGNASLSLKDTTTAISAFEKASVLDTASVEAAGKLAGIYVKRREFRNAADQYVRILGRYPDDKSALFYAGYSFSVLEKFDSAKTMYKRYVELMPQSVQGRLSLAQAYANMDSLAITRKIYQGTLTLLDSLSSADTLDAAAKAEKYNPQYIAVYQVLAVMYYQEKDYPAAISTQLKAIQYEGKKKEEKLHLFLAQLYNVARGQKTLSPEEVVAYRDKAVAEYNVVLQINPRNATALKERGQIIGK